jgi:transcriptional regulator with XRE-family HTH domain
VNKLTIGDRIKRLRKYLDLTQKEFGERIGIKGNTVAQYELGRNEPIDAVLSLICREYNVNESWLRSGEGEMFKAAPSDVLDQLANEYHLSNASYIAVEKFVNLNSEKRNELIGFFLEVAKAIAESDADPNAPAIPDSYAPGFSEDLLIQAFNLPKTPDDLEKKFPPVDGDDEGSKTG